MSVDLSEPRPAGGDRQGALRPAGGAAQGRSGQAAPGRRGDRQRGAGKTLAGRRLVKETIADQELVFLPALKRAEEGIAARIKALAAGPPELPAY